MDIIDQATESVSNQLLSIRSGIYNTSPLIPVCLFREKYLENGLSMRAIAREFSCSKTHVRNLLIRYKIPLRDPHKYSRWYTYGKRKVSGKTIAHKGELRTIDTIRQMYSEGLSVSAIARFLNTMKVPTKQQGKGWHHHTITQILKREGVYVERRGLKYGQKCEKHPFRDCNLIMEQNSGERAKFPHSAVMANSVRQGTIR